jgi:hypothetical protein
MARSSIRFVRAALAASSGIHRARWCAVGRGGVALITLFLLGQTAGAEDDEEPDWIPSLSFALDAFPYGTTTTVENHLNPPAQEDKQSNPSNQLMYQIGGELMGPMFEGLPGRPRIFVQGGVGMKSFSSDNIYRVGDIGGSAEDEITTFQTRLAAEKMRRCEDEDPPSCSTMEAGDVGGQGSEIDAEFQNPSWYAALGVSFNMPVHEKLLLQVKPSVAYSGENIDVVGKFTTVIEPSADMFEVYRGTAEASTTDHSLGMGLELALVLFRSVRPVTTSLFVDVRMLWLISDPTTTFSDPAGLATYTVTRDEFGVRGGAGLRFSWMGFGAD